MPSWFVSICVGRVQGDGRWRGWEGWEVEKFGVGHGGREGMGMGGRKESKERGKVRCWWREIGRLLRVVQMPRGDI